MKMPRCRGLHRHAARCLAAAACTVMPLAVAQLRVPDNLPPLEHGHISCSQAKTHCLVNYEDWKALEKALEEAQAENSMLHAELDRSANYITRLEAQKYPHCAVLTPEHTASAQ